MVWVKMYVPVEMHAVVLGGGGGLGFFLALLMLMLCSTRSSLALIAWDRGLRRCGR